MVPRPTDDPGQVGGSVFRGGRLHGVSTEALGNAVGYRYPPDALVEKDYYRLTQHVRSGRCCGPAISFHRRLV